MSYGIDIIVWIFVILQVLRIITGKTKLIYRLSAIVLVGIAVLFLDEIAIFVVVLLIRLILHYFLTVRD